jgi:DNA-binding XRE family transcriptional regulator
MEDIPLKNKIKCKIFGAGFTITKVAEEISKRSGKKESLANLSKKIKNETISYKEILELADVIGYELVWIKKPITEMSIGRKLINTIIKRRKELGIDQRKLEELSGILQPAIARLEAAEDPNPSIATIIKLAKPLGLVLTVGPKDDNTVSLKDVGEL